MIFQVQAHPYNTDVVFAMDVTDAQLERYVLNVLKASESVLESLRECNQSFSRKTVAAKTITFDNGGILIRLKHKVLSSSGMGLVAHECYHAVCEIFRRVGIPLTEDTEESRTYLLQYLCTEAFRKIGNRHWK